ncbi:MAG: glycosyltransferase family protein [Prevotellaceae bacterium]|nr:glycosyltransferase family protein [Prevotellaceae bacterium]
MFSLIICSRTPDIPQNLKENIAETIGVEYELIVIDNSNNEYSIFAAYNEGIRRAKGEVLCFMHEDILFYTQNWGKNIFRHFEVKTIGLIGVAGTHFLPNKPIYWTDSPLISEYNLTNNCGKRIECFKTHFFKGEKTVDVVACDGLCFFVRKSLFIPCHSALEVKSHIFFDEKTYTGFHYYDMDICMQVLKAGYKVAVCNDVLIEHFFNVSKYRTKKDMLPFEVSKNKFFQKWKNNLPIWRGIDNIPQYSLERINNLYKSEYEMSKKVKSKEYKIGYRLLHPFKLIRKILNIK